MTWPAPRRSRQVPIRPCPILTTRSSCRSIRPSRPSTCSIIREARPSRNASMYSSNIPVAGCASSTISLCEYLLPFESKTTLLFFFTFRNLNTSLDISYEQFAKIRIYTIVPRLQQPKTLLQIRLFSAES